MPSPPFPLYPSPPPRQDDPYAAARGHQRAPPNTRARTHIPPNETPCSPRGILRTTPPSHVPVTPYNPTANPQIARPQPPPIPRSTTTSPYHHHHTSSSPELRPRVDNAWAPRARPPDLSQTNTSSPSHVAPHNRPPPRGDLDDALVRRSGFTVRVNPHFVPGIRGRSASDVRIVHTPPPDLDPDRLARACGQPAPSNVYRHDVRGGQVVPADRPSSRLNESVTARTADASLSHPPIPKIKLGHMYRRLDTLARRSERRAMDYVGFEDVLAIHKQDNHLREQLRRKRSERLQEKDPNFHAIGAPLEDVLLYASTPIIIGDYHHHLPVVIVACIEELTKTGIYQSGLFRALPSRDRHLQLIDLFDKSADFGAHFSMRGQAMPDVCALLSTFISSLPAPLFDSHIYSAFWQWCVKPSTKREDARRDQQEEEEEERRARGEPPQWTPHTDLYLDDADSALETVQVYIAQILLRFLPSANLSLLVYLCGFFTQLPLCPENGLQLEDVSRIFGHRLLGGSAKQVSQRMMMWLLTRWHRISDTLFGETCGISPSSSPRHASQPGNSEGAGEGSHERIEKRRGERENESGDAQRHATSSSESHSSPSTESHEDRGAPSRKSSSDGEEDGEKSESSRRRKKRELDVQDPRTNVQAGHRPSTHKEGRHGHGHGRHGSGSRRRRHHHARSSEHKNSPTSPDPFAIAFAKAQQELADSPLLAEPSSARAGGEGTEKPRELVSRFDTPNPQRFDTPVRILRYENDARRADVDICVVDALLQETAVATDVAKALVERVEVLERVLHVRDGIEVQAGHPSRRDAADEDGGGRLSKGEGEGEGGKGNGDKDVEDGLRLQLRRVEAERDKARRIVRDVRAYLLEEGLTFQQG